MAYKFYDEEYETNLRDIEWSMGKTGTLTPVAIYDDVDTDDSIINRASLHNLNIMNQLLGKPYKGQKIWVCKQNEIIPQVVRSEKSNVALTYIDIPAKCPVCGGDTYVKDDFLYCGNPNCDGKFINQLEHFCGKKGLDIKGLSEATLQKLVDWGWVGNYQELFSLSNFRDEWVKKPGFGEKSVDKLLSTIEEARHCELWQFISALSIPLIGSTYAKEIAKRSMDWFCFRECVEKNYDFTAWERFGYEMNESLHRFNYSQADDLAYKILDIHNSLWIDPQATTPVIKFSEVNGKTFVVTGSVHQFKNRDEVKVAIETRGGKVTNSVTKNTDYLINNDINSTSSKNVKAKQLGIPIITEEQLIAML
jgi:DNA ligase (NAD+)